MVDGSSRDMNGCRGAYLDQSSYDTQAGQPQVLEWPGLACGIQKGIQKEWYICCTT